MDINTITQKISEDIITAKIKNILEKVTSNKETTYFNSQDFNLFPLFSIFKADENKSSETLIYIGKNNKENELLFLNVNFYFKNVTYIRVIKPFLHQIHWNNPYIEFLNCKIRYKCLGNNYSLVMNILNNIKINT